MLKKLIITLFIISNIIYGENIKIKDSYKEIEINVKDIKKIVSLAPNITEIIYAIGAEEKLAARTNYCDYPKEVENIISVGEIINPSMEIILSLKPDIVLASSHISYNTYKKLDEKGIKVLIFNDIKSIDDIYELIKNIGTVCSEKENADKIIEEMQNNINKIKNKQNTGIKIYYMLSYGKSGDYTAGGDTFVGEVIRTAGCINAAENVSGWKYSIEQLINENPDVILFSNDFINEVDLKKSNGYKNINAIKNGNIYMIKQDVIIRPGPRIWIGINQIREIVEKLENKK